MSENAAGECPNGEAGSIAKPNRFCKIADCAFNKGISLCFQCPDFPCEITKSGPISYVYCEYIAVKNS